MLVERALLLAIPLMNASKSSVLLGESKGRVLIHIGLGDILLIDEVVRLESSLDHILAVKDDRLLLDLVGGVAIGARDLRIKANTLAFLGHCLNKMLDSVHLVAYLILSRGVALSLCLVDGQLHVVYV